MGSFYLVEKKPFIQRWQAVSEKLKAKKGCIQFREETYYIRDTIDFGFKICVVFKTKINQIPLFM